MNCSAEKFVKSHTDPPVEESSRGQGLVRLSPRPTTGFGHNYLNGEKLNPNQYRGGGGGIMALALAIAFPKYLRNDLS